MDLISVEEYYNEEHYEILKEQEMIRKAEVATWVAANNIDIWYDEDFPTWED